ncbi:MAG: ubiquinol-cytochrome C chaperone family protein [Alphaproteobacteria bacterium]|nr:ubiquinol-cytochrome C chaperone family protein [Alphaproteobacteria bacterium]
MGIAQWFGRGFGRARRNKWAVDRLHQLILAQALRPEFYVPGAARDNFSGRFEVTSLHAALVFRRLRSLGGTGKALAQDCFDALFEGFDEALRDIGTGDLSVGKKIRKMGEAFYGRARAYDEALAQDAPPDALAGALGRNLGLSEDLSERLARYVKSVEDTLGRHSDEALLAGEVNWPKPSLA